MYDGKGVHLTASSNTMTSPCGQNTDGQHRSLLLKGVDGNQSYRNTLERLFSVNGTCRQWQNKRHCFYFGLNRPMETLGGNANRDYGKGRMGEG